MLPSLEVRGGTTSPKNRDYSPSKLSSKVVSNDLIRANKDMYIQSHNTVESNNKNQDEGSNKQSKFDYNMVNSGVRRNVESPLQNLNIKTVFSDKSNVTSNPTYKNANTPNSIGNS